MYKCFSPKTAIDINKLFPSPKHSLSQFKKTVFIFSYMFFESFLNGHKYHKILSCNDIVEKHASGSFTDFSSNLCPVNITSAMWKLIISFGLKLIISFGLKLQSSCKIVYAINQMKQPRGFTCSSAFNQKMSATPQLYKCQHTVVD